MLSSILPFDTELCFVCVLVFMIIEKFMFPMSCNRENFPSCKHKESLLCSGVLAEAMGVKLHGSNLS